MSPKAPALFFAGLVLLASSASAAKIQTRSDPEADFSTFHTYAWRASNASDTLVERDVHAAADGVLAEKGLRKVGANESPDLWIEFVVGSLDMLRAEWKADLGWWGSLWLTPGVRSRVEAGLMMVVSANGRGAAEDRPVWGGKVTMAGNNPNSLMVMAGMVGKQTRKMMKKYPSPK